MLRMISKINTTMKTFFLLAIGSTKDTPQNAAIFATVLPRPPVFLRASRTKYNMLAIPVINEAVTDNVLAFF